MTKYRSIDKLIDAAVDDESLREKLQDRLEAHRMGKLLFAIRCAKGVSQQQIANKVGCSQSTISKIEHSEDERISFGDLVAYAKALEFNLTISFHPPMTLANKLRYHSHCLKVGFESLVKLAADDPKMIVGVGGFMQESFLSFVSSMAENLKRLNVAKSSPSKKKLPILTVDATPALLGERPDSPLIKC